MIANDGVEPSLPELVRKTHTFKDGTFADGRSKKIVEEVESAATERLMTDSVKESTATTPSVQQLNKLFIEDVFMGLDLLIATMVIQLHPHPLLSHVPCIWRQE
ncbi:hypothetical protein Bca4012_063213 [Brassica carinata]